MAFSTSSDLAATSAQPGYLQGQLLVATPMVGGAFAHAVILVLSHSDEGAMGLILNRPMDDVAYGDVYEQLGLQGSLNAAKAPVHFGGPVEMSRGFVLYHPQDGRDYPDSIHVGDVAISASARMLEAIAQGEGPTDHMLTIGYAGWGPGQLEREIEDNSWIVAPATPELIFDRVHDGKWQRAALSLGVDLAKFSPVAGHA